VNGCTIRPQESRDKCAFLVENEIKKYEHDLRALILRGCKHVDQEARWWHGPLFRGAFGRREVAELVATRWSEIPNCETFGLCGSIGREVEGHTGSRGVRSVLRNTLCWAPRPRTWRLSFFDSRSLFLSPPCTGAPNGNGAVHVPESMSRTVAARIAAPLVQSIRGVCPRGDGGDGRGEGGRGGRLEDARPGVFSALHGHLKRHRALVVRLVLVDPRPCTCAPLITGSDSSRQPNFVALYPPGLKIW